MNRNRTLLTILAVTAALALAACGSDSAPKSGAPASAGADGSWQATLQQARGQTVRWWMYGGDDKINAYVDDDVAAALAKFGVTLKRVLAINGRPRSTRPPQARRWQQPSPSCSHSERA